jgi:hypothetical protein
LVAGVAVAPASAVFLLFFVFFAFSVDAEVSEPEALAFFGAAKLAVESPTAIIVAIAICFNLFSPSLGRFLVPHLDHASKQVWER